jgi:Family of unknown function (DUF6190)
VTDSPIFVDATVFLSMHHRDNAVRLQSVAFFARLFRRRVHMNYEQVGICDAVIWQQSREVQDLYYPFMDRLHSEMDIAREGYNGEVLRHAAARSGASARLRPEQQLLASQVELARGKLATHDPALRALAELRDRLWPLERDDLAAFPPDLHHLYDVSRAFVHGLGE